MAYRRQSYECNYCQANEDLFDKKESLPERYECPRCQQGEMVKLFKAPAMMRTALPDGTDRGDNWKKMKEAAKLKTEAANMPHEKRSDHYKQIKKLERSGDK